MPNKDNKTTITFYGGVGGVTGSHFVVEHGDFAFAVDAGFFQGCDTCDTRNREPFLFDPTKLKFLLVTHAHVDHVGRIPKLVHDGFSGKIFSTPPTKDIARLMLEDSLSVFREDETKTGQKPLYNEKDIERAMELWQVHSYREAIVLGEGFSAVFRDAGHALGSSMIEIKRNGKTLLVTGDLGNSPSPLLPDTEIVGGVSYVVMESVYGDRTHEDRARRKEHLEDIIEDSVRRRGVLLIPAFSYERTQELLFEISNMMKDSEIPLIPIFLDSPLAIKITEVYEHYKNYFNKKARSLIGDEEKLFAFPQINMTPRPEDSKVIERIPAPKIIIAGSGMSTGGRILFHEKKYLSDPATTLLIMGYQAPDTLGRKLQEGMREAEILGARVKINARVITLGGYSAHRDAEGLFDFAAHVGDRAKRIFVVMGETKSSAFFTQRLRDYLGFNAMVPEVGVKYELEM